jgi:hypothetical protein
MRTPSTATTRTPTWKPSPAGAGNTKATYGYTAYGSNDHAQFTGIDKPDPADPTKQPYNLYRYNAKRWDPTSGSYDMGFRDYHPASTGSSPATCSTAPWPTSTSASTPGPATGTPSPAESDREITAGRPKAVAVYVESAMEP